MHSGPIIAEKQGFPYECSGSYMSFTKAVVNVLEDIVTLLESDAFQPRAIVGLLVKYPV